MKRFTFALLTGSAIVLSGLTSCAPSPTSEMAAPSAAMEPSADSEAAPAPLAAPGVLTQKTSADSGSLTANTAEAVAEGSVTQATQRPQLIQRASLALSVDAVEAGFEQVRKIVADQQGDVLNMSDTGDRQRILTFEIRVPQAKLDATLDALSAIGKIRDRTISTEDVSNQLVDLQARLINARKSEAALQEIMSRSGDIADVLAVARELSAVRQNIEQMTAQQKNLQTQVSYSTISLNLTSDAIAAVDKPTFSRQLTNSWEGATSSVGEFTTDLLQIGLWLLVYSPYLAVLLGGVVIARKVTRRLSSSPNSPD